MMSSQRFSTNVVNSGIAPTIFFTQSARRGTDTDCSLRQRTWLWLCGGLWVYLVAFSGTCAVLGARFGSCEDGPPIFLYITFVVLLLVMEAWQFWTAFPSKSDCCEKSNEKLCFVVVCGLGCFEILDSITDGQQIAQAHLCDSDFHDAWVRSFDQAHSPVVWVVGALHMWGILAVCQVLAVGAKGILLLIFSGAPDTLPLTCSFVGLGGLLVDNEEEEDAKGVSQVVRAIGVDLIGTSPATVALRVNVCRHGHSRSVQATAFAGCVVRNGSEGGG